MRRLAFFIALLFASAAQAQTPCPTGYVLVPNESTYGLGNFCVAKYEMKSVGGIATSQASGTPWASITRAAAKSACSALGPDYHLITNPERLVIARGIEATGSNWSTGIVNSGDINRGHSDSTPNNTLAANADDDQACEGTGQTCSSTVWDNQRRTHNLPGGGVIWDFAGNIRDWVDWTIPSTDKATPYGDAWGEINASTPTTSMPQISYWPTNTSLLKARGVGGYYPGLSGTGGYVATGGHWYNVGDAGIYSINLNNSSIYTNANTGFRCTFQVKPQDFTVDRAPSWQIRETRPYGQATTVDFALYDLLGVNLKTDAVDGGLDCTIMKDEGAETACANDFVDEGRTYSISLTALEMSAKQITICIVDADAPDVYLANCFKIFTTTSGM